MADHLIAMPSDGAVDDDMLRVGAWLGRRPAGSLHGRFVEHIVPALWVEGLRYGVDPVGLVAMSLHETDGGRFTGAVPWTFRNTCGLRVEPEGLEAYDTAIAVQAKPGGVVADALLTLSHACFATWALGARAHAQHVVAYSMWAPGAVPLDELVDPRYRIVRKLGRQATTWRQLGGLWASQGYGDKLDGWVGEIKAAL